MNDYNTYSILMYISFTLIGFLIGVILWYAIFPVVIIELLILWCVRIKEKRDKKVM